MKILIGLLICLTSYSCRKDVVRLNEEEATFSIYPNPFINNINILPTGVGEYSIQIYNTKGELVFSEFHLSFKQKVIDLQTVESGVYFIHIKAKNITVIEKVLKE